jgi:GAF domain-containing protein/CheY-like chemotaxis protein
VRVALGRPAIRRVVPVLIGLVVLWFVAGIFLARALAARHDTAATATLASVRTIVAAALEEVRREASLLARDPAVVEGATRSDWATLVRGAWPRILALTQERRADLLLIVDASGAPLVQVPAARHVVAAAVARPPEAVARLAVIDERPYVLGVAPMPDGLVIVGRRFESLAGAVGRLPSRPALVVVAGDRALGSTLPGAPPHGWDTAVRAGQITINGELWFARQLGEAGGGLWALVSAREQRRESSQLWFWWAVSLSAAGATAVGIAAVSGSERGDEATERGPRPTRPGEAPLAGREASAAGRETSAAGREASDNRRSRELEALHAVVVATASGDDLALTAERTLEVVCGVAGIPFGGVFRFDRATQTLVLTAHRGLLPDDVERLRVRSLDQSHVGEVIRSGRPVVTDLTASRVLAPDIVERVQAGGYRTQLGLPIPVNGETWGVMALITREARTFDADELTLLQAVAHQVGQAVARAALLAEGREKSRRLETLARLAQTLTATLSLDEVFRRVVDAAVELFGSSTAQLWLVDDDDRHVSLRAAAGIQSSEGVERLRVGEGLVGLVVASREPLTAVDALRDPRARNVERVPAEGVVSVGIVPLQLGERVLGVLAIGVRARHEYTVEELRLLGFLASHAANAINNAQLYRESTRQAQRMSALTDLVRLVSETLDFDPAAQRVADSVCSLLGARASCLYRVDPASDALVAFATSRDADQLFQWQPVLPSGTGIAGLAVSQRCSVASADVLADSRITYTDDTRARVAQEAHRSLLAVPLLVQGRMVGALAVSDRVGRVFDESEIRLAQAFADQAALALENARLYTEATRRRLEAEELARLARTLTESLDPRAVGDQIAESVLVLFRARSSVLRLLQPDGSLVTLARGGHLRDASPLGAVLPAGVGASGRAAVEGRAVTSPDVCNDPSIVLSEEVAETIRRAGDGALLAVPLRAKGRIIGTLSLGDASGRVFSEAEVGLLQAFGDQAALALENAHLYAQNRQQVEELSVLYELSRAVTGQLDRATLLEAIRAQVARILDAANMAIVLLDDERRDLEVVLRTVDGARDMRTPLRYPSRAGLMSVVLVTGEAVLTEDYIAECARRGVEPVATFAHPRHWLGVPMTAGDTVIGVLTLRSADRAFTEADERLLTNIADLAALSLRNARLFEERTRAYGELAAAQDQLVRTEKLRALGEMASGVAHDFNNLLASILGRAQLTLQRLQDPQLRKWIQVIERAALDGAQTVRRLQEFTRIRRDQQRFVAVDLNEVVRGALEITQSRWREETRSRGVAVDVQTSFASLLPVAGDPAELREAMTNLILNAVDAMPTGGTLTLTTALENNEVVVTVADSGVGIPEAIRGKIFDPFFTTKGPQGTGLGLSMTYGILSRHGGRITVESHVGRGTAFRLTFAPGEALDLDGPAPEPEPTPLGVSLRCLVVDDEEEVGTVLGDVLTTGGHRVVVLTDGGEAIARFRAEPFDLVFTDLAMPRVSGWQVAQAVKEIAPTVPVVLVTGFGVELSAEERQIHGVDLVVVKPLKIQDVLDVVARVARRRARQT